MNTTAPRVSYLLAICCFTCVSPGCYQEPNSRPVVKTALTAAPPPAQASNWTTSGMSLAQANHPDPIELPPVVDLDPLNDPLGGPDAMIQRIEVRGFGAVDSEDVFLQVEGSKRTAKAGDQVLIFIVKQIEDPFVTLQHDGRTWRLSSANKHLKQDGDHVAGMPVQPPPMGPEFALHDVNAEIEAEMARTVDDVVNQLEEEMAPEIPDLNLGVDPDGLGLDPAGDLPADLPDSDGPGDVVGPPGAP